MFKRFAFAVLVLSTLAGTILHPTTARADEGIYGSLDLRWEGWDNALQPNHDGTAGSDDDAYGYALLRSRLGYRAGIGGRGAFNLSLQNLRTLGAPPRAAKSAFGAAADGTVAIDEAWFGIEDFLLRGFAANAGRFALAYGQERLLGAEERSFYGQHRFDGFRGRYTFAHGWVDLLCLKLAETFADRYGTATTRAGDRDLRGAYAHLEAAPGLAVESYLLWTATTNWSAPDYPVGLRDDSSYSLGALLDYATGGLRLYAEGVYQGGTSHGDLLADDETPLPDDTARSACGVYAGASYEFATPARPRLGCEFDYATGQPQTGDADGKDRTFRSPYGSFSDYLGVMNIVDWSNTASFRLSGGLTPAEGTDLKLDLYFFRLATGGQALQQKPNAWVDLPDGIATGGVYDREVGTELDIAVEHRLGEGVRFDAGLGLFTCGDYFGVPNQRENILHGWVGSTVRF